MKKLTRQRLLASTLLIGSAVIATPAFAQAVPQTPDNSVQGNADTTATQDAAAPDIVITGSLIRNPNLVSSSPVNAIGADEIDLRQSNVAEQLLRELPGAVASIGSAVNNGNGGSSYVDLRGLGSNRNVVLLDGVRIAPADLLGRVDLNNIPLALIERVDSLTGAAVTTYGADAITGVVNFVTRNNFAGVELNASQQITEQGDGNIFRIDATIGANFADGRGNAVLSVGYQEADPVFQGDRAFSVEQIDSYTGTTGGSATAVPTVIATTRGIDPLTGLPSNLASVGNGTGNGRRQIDPATGRAVPLYAPFNFNPYNVFQTPFERYNIFAKANYEVSDAVEVYTRGLFSKNSVKTIIAPSGVFGTAVNINLNNPYLPTGLRRQLCAFDVDPRAGIYTPRFTPGECDAAATATGRTDPNYREIGTGTFVPADLNGDGTIGLDPVTGRPNEGYNNNPAAPLSRRATEVGPRVSTYTTTIFDYQLGARGAITDRFNYDVFGSYGESENVQTIEGYVLTSRARQSLLVDSVDGVPTCQNTSNGCVATNWFGAEGSITPDMVNYLTAASTSSVRSTLAQVRGTVSGDLGFAIPSASDPIGIAIGGEYRRYTAEQRADILAGSSGELGGAGGATLNFSGGFKVWEAFGEINAPLVQDKPFFESLTLEAGIRYSSYSVDAPGNPKFETTTWKAGGSWEPGAGLRIRGNYNRAVRAPNIDELFSPLNTELTNLAVDPCAGAAPTTNATLAAVCLAQGAPAGAIGNIANPTSAQANVTKSGTFTLSPETASTWTVGAVWQPEFFRGFTLSADYYNIKVKNVIGEPLPGDLIGACFDNLTTASATSAACTVIRRNPATGGLDGDPATAPGLFAPTGNLGQLATDGIDLTANYTTDVGFGRLSLGFVGNWTNSSRFKASPTSIDRECVGYYSVNCSFTGSIQPEFQFSQRTTLSIGDVDLSLLWRYIDAVRFEPAQLEADLANAVAAGTDPVNGCPDPTGTDPNGCMVDPEFRRIPAEHYFDLTMRFNATTNLAFTLQAQNLFDNKPYVVGNSLGSTSYNSGNVYPSTYDALGRRFAASVRLKF